MFSWSTNSRPIIALSPMADMTDSAFCRVVREVSGPRAVIFREMVSAEALIRDNKKTLSMTAFDEIERPIVQQLFGAEPEGIAAAIRRIDELRSPDAFDLNMGCPVHKMVCNFNGAALMREPEKAASIVRAAKAATNKPLSVKMRLGWNENDEVLKFAPIIEAAGADMITVHGRTRAQGYSGTADWQTIGQVKKLISVPLLVNGDIVSGDTARQALEVTGADGVMIGRGSLGNPWIFAEIEAALAGRAWTPPTWEEKVAVIRRHAELHAAVHYPDAPLVTFRTHLTWYCRGFAGAKEWRAKLVKVVTMEDLDEVLAS